MSSRLSPTPFKKTRNRQAAFGAAVGQHGRRRHEPQFRDVIVDALGVVGVVAIGARHPCEHVLKALAGEEIAVLHGLLAEVGEEGVAGAVDLNVADHFKGRFLV